MQAIIRTRYGSPDVLQLKDVEKPIPKAGELLIQIQAASVNAADWHFMRGKPFLARTGGNGLRKPKDQRLGIDLAGRVEAIGSNVTQFQVGDAVFGRAFGTFAEYVCAREDTVVLKPAALPFDAAAAVPTAALIALQGLRDNGQIQPGQQVLIHGASGGVGTFAVQIAKSFGTEVTAVCSTRNVDLARSVGADHVIDYTHDDFARSGQRYDLIVAVNGYRPLSVYRRALRPNGRYVMIGASNAKLFQALLQIMLLGPIISRAGTKKMSLLMAKLTHKDLVCVQELLEAGKIKPVIGRRYPLRETAQAIRYVEAGHARGKVIITI